MGSDSFAPVNKRPTPADIAWRVSLRVVDMRSAERTWRIITNTIVAGSAEQAHTRAKDNMRASGFKVMGTLYVRSASRA